MEWGVAGVVVLMGALSQDRDQTLTMKVVAEVVGFSGWADWLRSVRERVAEMG